MKNLSFGVAAIVIQHGGGEDEVFDRHAAGGEEACALVEGIERAAKIEPRVIRQFPELAGSGVGIS